MSKKSFFFYGIYEGNEGDDTWRVLHDHFEKLSKEERIIDAYFSDGPATKQKVRDEVAGD